MEKRRRSSYKINEKCLCSSLWLNNAKKSYKRRRRVIKIVRERIVAIKIRSLVGGGRVKIFRRDLKNLKL